MRLLLSHPLFFNFFIFILGGLKFKKGYSAKFICASENDSILDIGSGTSDILQFLPSSCKYVGFDASEQYINFAKKKYGDRGQFVCGLVSEQNSESYGKFDIVMANCVLHHLDDKEAESLFALTKHVLKPGGRLVTLDGCYTDSQSFLKRFILRSDRGKYVRTREGYESICSKVFPHFETTIYENDGIMPYTYITMVCTK